MMISPAVLLDIGSEYVRAGFAGEFEPRRVLRSPFAVGKKRRRRRERDSGGNEGEVVLSHSPKWLRWSQAKLQSVLTPFVASLYADVLHCKPWDRNVILCEPLVGATSLRQALAEVFFSHFGVPALGCLSGPLPCLYCTDSLTGLIVDIGSYETHVLAVWRGVPIQASYKVIPGGVTSVLDSFEELLLHESPSMADVLSHPQVLQDTLAKTCRICPIPFVDEDRLKEREAFAQSLKAVQIMIGNPIELGVVSPTARVGAGEVIFDGEEGGLGGAILSSLEKCPIDVRPALAQRVIPIGGGAMLTGLPLRLQAELRLHATRTRSSAWVMDFDVKLTPFPHDSLVWVGASAFCAAVLGSHSGSSVCMVSREHFEALQGQLPDWTNISLV